MLATKRRLLVATLAVTFAGGAQLIPSAAVAAPNPPGNNGTIKIDGEPFDGAPDNEPHVGCKFQVDFYGYDKGDLHADVTFRAHPPTRRSGGNQVLLTDKVFIGQDDNSGGASEAGLDASRTYTLDFTGITPHPQQGFHVKLTINADGSRGADVKHKVFWVTGCQPKPPEKPTKPERPAKPDGPTPSKRKPSQIGEVPVGGVETGGGGPAGWNSLGLLVGGTLVLAGSTALLRLRSRGASAD